MLFRHARPKFHARAELKLGLKAEFSVRHEKKERWQTRDLSEICVFRSPPPATLGTIKRQASFRCREETVQDYPNPSKSSSTLLGWKLLQSHMRRLGGMEQRVKGHRSIFAFEARSLHGSRSLLRA